MDKATRVWLDLQVDGYDCLASYLKFGPLWWYCRLCILYRSVCMGVILLEPIQHQASVNQT